MIRTEQYPLNIIIISFISFMTVVVTFVTVITTIIFTIAIIVKIVPAFLVTLQCTFKPHSIFEAHTAPYKTQ